MAYFNGTVYSEKMGMMTDLAVSLPDNPKRRTADGGMPVLYLLHGLSDNHAAWSLRTKVDLYAGEVGAAIVMPEVQRSFYTDMHCGAPYYSYITEELPAICQRLFRVSDRREDTYIAGLSMGGYGAMKAVLTSPQRYAAAASFSGAVDARREMFGEQPLLGDGERYAVYGDTLPERDDLFLLAQQAKDCPPLYLCVGESDFLLDDNRRFEQHLTACGIAHSYEEWPGGHEWRFWDAAVEKALHFFMD